MTGKTWVTGPDVELALHSDDPETSPISLSGIIDTGASVICVDSRVAKRLRLVASNMKRVQMADGREVLSTLYTARMTIPALEFDDYVQVCGVNYERPSTRVLIGRSFLRDYIVNYNGPLERFEFHQTNMALEYYFEHDE